MIYRLPGLLINIRKPEINDVACIARWLSSDAYIDNFGKMYKANLKSYEQKAKKMLQDNADDFSTNKYFLVEDRFKGCPIALAMLCKIDWKNRHAEYACIIGESNYRGKLVAGDMNVVLYNYFFNELNLNKIYGFVVADNTTAQRMNNFGGSHDGVLRMHRFRDSRIATNVHVFSITQAEFSHFVNEHKDTLLKKHIKRGLIK